MVTNAFYRYTVALEVIKDRLRLQRVLWVVRPETRDHMVLILEWFAKDLIEEGEEDIWDLVKLVLDNIESNVEKVCSGAVKPLMMEVGEKLEIIEDATEQDRFIVAMLEFMISLKTQLLLQYETLLSEPKQQGCGVCCCGEGEGQKEWEDWISGVWPKEEKEMINKKNIIKESPASCSCAYRK